MPNLGGRFAQSQTEAMHSFAVLHAHFDPEYSLLYSMSKQGIKFINQKSRDIKPSRLCKIKFEYWDTQKKDCPKAALFSVSQKWIF